jgi:surface antigen
MITMTKKFALVLATSSLLLAGCESAQNNPKQTGGTLIGGALGGLAGAQFGKGTGKLAAVAGGALLGAFLGSEIGSSLDKADKMYASQAEQKAHTAPVGQKISWNNPDSGHSGSFTPVREGRDTSSGQACREYKQTVNVDGRTQEATGTACQQADGSWKVVQ